MNKTDPTTTRLVDYFSTDHLKPILKKLAIRATGATVFAQALNELATV